MFNNVVITAKHNHEDVTNCIERSQIYNDFEFHSIENEATNNSTFIIQTQEEINTLTIFQDQ